MPPIACVCRRQPATHVQIIPIGTDSPHSSGVVSNPDVRRSSARIGLCPDDDADVSGVDDTTAERRVSFAREKFLWLEQVRADAELTPLAFMLAYVLADLINERLGCAWPSIARLAADCRVTERGVQKVLRRLVERGHLSVELGNGRGETNRYRWIVKADDGVRTADNAQNTRQASRRNGEAAYASSSPIQQERTPVHPIHAERVNHGSEKGELPFKKGRTPVHPTLSKESRSCHQLGERRSEGPPDSQDWFCVIHRRSAESEGPTDGATSRSTQ